MNYRELISALVPRHGLGEAQAIVRMVAEERFGLSFADLLLGKDTQLPADDRAEWEKIASRLVNGEPAQYVLGYADFCGHRFRVCPDVLIPRPETEELVRRAEEGLNGRFTAEREVRRKDKSSGGEDEQEKSRERTLRILDLCTGSGCIAISLALAFPEAQVEGVDISESALAVARQNACELGAPNVVFSRHDVLSEAADEWCPPACRLMVSNPPYVCHSEASAMAATVLDFEPHLALFVPDDDPLRFYRALAVLARRSLLPGGLFFAELGQGQVATVCQLFREHGFRDVHLYDDAFGKPRILAAVQGSPLNHSLRAERDTSFFQS